MMAADDEDNEVDGDGATGDGATGDGATGDSATTMTMGVGDDDDNDGDGAKANEVDNDGGDQGMANVNSQLHINIEVYFKIHINACVGILKVISKVVSH